jgi:hypothetical protein
MRIVPPFCSPPPYGAEKMPNAAASVGYVSTSFFFVCSKTHQGGMQSGREAGARPPRGASAYQEVTCHLDKNIAGQVVRCVERPWSKATLSPGFAVEDSAKTSELEARAEETGGGIYASGSRFPSTKGRTDFRGWS